MITAGNPSGRERRRLAEARFDDIDRLDPTEIEGDQAMIVDVLTNGLKLGPPHE
jgi:hypothetical protein